MSTATARPPTRVPCPARTCDGYAWVRVDGTYVEAQVARQRTLWDDPDAVEFTPAYATALANSVRPCEVCNPEGYRLWHGGHYRPNHSCAECRPEPTRKAA